MAPFVFALLAIGAVIAIVLAFKLLRGILRWIFRPKRGKRNICSQCASAIPKGTKFCEVCGTISDAASNHGEPPPLREPSTTSLEKEGSEALTADEVPVPDGNPAPDEESSTAPESLHQTVLEALDHAFGLDGLQYSDDGVATFGLDGMALQIRVEENPLQVAVFAPLLENVPLSMDLLQTANDLNSRTSVPGRVFWDENTLAILAFVAADPFIPSHLSNVCKRIRVFADAVDEELKATFVPTVDAEGGTH